MIVDQFICTAETPWTAIRVPPPPQGFATMVLHPDAKKVGDQRDGWPSGDLVTMRCPHCGHEWEKELPQ
jgi:hypothetical protein